MWVDFSNNECFLSLYSEGGDVFKKLTIDNKQLLDILDKIMVFRNKYNFGDGVEMVNPKNIENLIKNLQLYIDKMGLK